MTIASSVVDVRNVDKNELFFYRVGCVPEVIHVRVSLLFTQNDSYFHSLDLTHIGIHLVQA